MSILTQGMTSNIMKAQKIMPGYSGGRWEEWDGDAFNRERGDA